MFKFKINIKLRLNIERNSGEGNGNPVQYSCLENPMDRGAWQAAVHGGLPCWEGFYYLRGAEATL